MLSIRMPLGAFLYWLSRIKLKDKTTKIFGEYNEVKKIEWFLANHFLFEYIFQEENYGAFTLINVKALFY